MFCMNHLDDVEMTYFEHLYYSSKLSFINIVGGLLGIVHGFCPYILTNIHNETLNTLRFYIDGKTTVTKKIE